MQDTFLNKILNAKQLRVAAAQRACDPHELRGKAELVRRDAGGFRLSAALARTDRNNIIAEIKRASPSRGVLCGEADVVEIARAYENGGAAAISILTEEDYFQGSLQDLLAIRSACRIPLLRKDFVISDFQIYESAAAGADAILLIVAALEPSQLKSFLALAHEQLHMDAIVEVHTASELRMAIDAGATVIGVNNRNLKTFEISLETSRSLIASKQPGTIYISESGIERPEQVAELRTIGFDGFLIGETFMRSEGDRADAVRAFSTPAKPHGGQYGHAH